MSLIRSKLFWKIAGLYVLLSVPAIVGLVAALQTRLYADAVRCMSSSCRRFCGVCEAFV